MHNLLRGVKKYQIVIQKWNYVIIKGRSVKNIMLCYSLYFCLIFIHLLKEIIKLMADFIADVNQ